MKGSLATVPGKRVFEGCFGVEIVRSFAFKPLEVAKVLAEPHYEANWRFFGGLLGVVSPFSGQGLVVLPPLPPAFWHATSSHQSRACRPAKIMSAGHSLAATHICSCRLSAARILGCEVPVLQCG